ncbi:MAG: peptidylprolyl isomerase [Thiohalomonadaceae bacterium]
MLGLGQLAWADNDHPRVRLVTDLGDIVLQLDRSKAPKTVENFLQYVEAGFYNGTIFHRVIDGFMVQGGGFTPNMVQKESRQPIQNEADNGLRNTIGTIAMARTSDPHSASAQFFINVGNNDFLDFREKTQRAWGYAVFGRVIKGMDTVKSITQVPTTTVGYFENVPAKPIIIQQAVILDETDSK